MSIHLAGMERVNSIGFWRLLPGLAKIKRLEKDHEWK
jgi:hypothetical protein